MRRHLVTTSDQRTWKFDRPVLFLGEWCRLYNARPVWEGMDAVVAEPFGVKPAEKERNHAYTQRLSEQLLRELADALNEFHGCRHTLRYWHIVLGHWLLRYVQILFNRYFTLEQALNNHEVSATTVLDSTAYSLATKDSMSLPWAANDAVWDHVLCARIINFLGRVELSVDAEARLGVGGFLLPDAPGAEPGLRAKTFAATNKILPLFARRHDAFIINSYLPKKEELKLQFDLGQVPQLWQSPPVPVVPPKATERQKLTIGASGHQGFEKYVRMQMPEMLPTCFVEGYRQLVELTESLPWPAEPRFIFTSNNFDQDEVFKVWTASKVEEGVRYYVGAHGNYNASPYMEADTRSPECVTADKFFTWGWSDDDPKFIPAFVFKTAGRRLVRNESDTGSLVLIELVRPHRKMPWDSYFEFGIYQEEQFRFVGALPEAIQKRLEVRLHPAYRRLHWGEEQRWRDRYPQIKLEAGLASIRDMIAGSRLLVYSYDSTGVVEALASNIPVMCFWHSGLYHVFPGALPYYAMLHEVGILAYTPEEAAANVARHWNDISGWWDSREVQDARASFCRQYAEHEDNPVPRMKRLLTANDNPAIQTDEPAVLRGNSPRQAKT